MTLEVLSWIYYLTYSYTTFYILYRNPNFNELLVNKLDAIIL